MLHNGGMQPEVQRVYNSGQLPQLRSLLVMVVRAFHSLKIANPPSAASHAIVII